MWLCEISSAGAPGSAGSLKRVSKYIIGQIVHIGRKTGSDIAFINDKSVSRNHAEFHLNDRGVLSVRDLKSKFMTYVVCNGVKMVVRDETILKHGDTVQIGACDSRIEVKHVSFLMCPTKLEKERKELLKTVTKKLNGKIVSALDADRSIITVADKFTATMKILESIILNLPIVTLKWVLDTYDTVERAKSSGHCLCLALSTNDYFPPGFESLQQSTQSMVSSLPISTQPPSGVVMENMNQSRKELFGDTLIYTFVEQRDDVSKDPYCALIEKCGGTILKLVREEVQNRTFLNFLPQITDKTSFIFEENSSEPLIAVLNDVIFNSSNKKSGCSNTQSELGILNVGVLAGCIINCTAPLLIPFSCRTDGGKGMATANRNGGAQEPKRHYHVTQSQYPEFDSVTPIGAAESSVDPNASGAVIKLIQPHSKVGALEVCGSSVGDASLLFEDNDEYQFKSPAMNSKPDPVSESASATDCAGIDGKVNKYSCEKSSAGVSITVLSHDTGSVGNLQESVITMPRVSRARTEGGGEVHVAKNTPVVVRPPTRIVESPHARTNDDDWISTDAAALVKLQLDNGANSDLPAVENISNTKKRSYTTVIALSNKVRADTAVSNSNSLSKKTADSMVAVPARESNARSHDANSNLSPDKPESPDGIMAPVLIDEEGWMSCAMMQAKANPCEIGGENTQIPAPTVEKRLLLPTHDSNANSNISVSSMSVSHDSQSSRGGVDGVKRMSRDVRVFRKNYVRMSQQNRSLSTPSQPYICTGFCSNDSDSIPRKRVALYRIGTMDKVYPKETERDLQLRLEAKSVEDIETHLQPVSLNENLSQLSTKKINRSSDQLGGTGMNKIQLATDGSSKPIEKISLKSNNRFLSSKISNNNLVEIQTPLSVDSTPSSNENLAIPLVAPIVNNRFLNSHQSNSKKK